MIESSQHAGVVDSVYIRMVSGKNEPFSVSVLAKGTVSFVRLPLVNDNLFILPCK